MLRRGGARAPSVNLVIHLHCIRLTSPRLAAWCRGPPGELAAAAVRPESVPKADFDFEAALSKFNKADVEKETEQVGPPSL